MASSNSFAAIRIITPVLFCFLMISSTSDAWLTKNFYSKSCPNLERTVKSVVKAAVAKEARMGASLLRLHFHDCFVNGCDGSILLDDTSTFIGEKNAAANVNSVRGFKVIDKIKSAAEKICPGVVSCADLLTLASRDSVTLLGGPRWSVKLGRRDSLTASQLAANTSLPGPSFNLTALISNFQNVGLSTTDLVALSGGHTIGLARCITFRTRIYNATNIDASFAKTRQQNCPSTSGNGDSRLAPLDQTPTNFDTDYFKNLINQKGLLNSDQVLYNGGSTDSLVKKYRNKPSTFFSDFVVAMIKMGDIEPLTGSRGQIRLNCRKPN